MACDPSLLKLGYNLSIPYGPRLIPEKKFFWVHFGVRVFFLPGFFLRSHFKSWGIFETWAIFFWAFKIKSWQRRCQDFILKAQKKIAQVSKMPQDLKWDLEKKPGRKKTRTPKWTQKYFFSGIILGP